MENTKELNNEKQCDIHVVVSSACLCEENAKGKGISGWCSKHHTDWM
tara:strand:- start:236 stop:376 length:141 start_codon:yes stop_codon:yes gene_type:complete